MNDTTQTMIRAILKCGGGFLLAHGLANDSQVQEITAALLSLIGIAWGIAHRSKNSAAGGRMVSIALCAIMAPALVGCSSFVKNTKKTEYAVAQLADGAMKSWALYYHEATNNPAQFHTTIETVEKDHAIVNSTARKIGASMQTLDGFLDSYQTNSAVQPALQAAIDSLSANATELSTLISSLTKTNAP